MVTRVNATVGDMVLVALLLVFLAIMFCLLGMADFYRYCRGFVRKESHTLARI